MLTTDARHTLDLTSSQKRLAETYEALSFWELHAVQRVHINDYLRYKAEGLAQDAANALAVVNDLGVLLDLRDGTISR